jgi:hypothetical protein
MRVVILVLTGLWLTLAAPAAAQLAQQYLEVSQGANLRKTITTYFEEAFNKAEMPADQREWLTQNMAVAFDQAMQATFADMTDDVAELFTEEELLAMIGFFDTPLGRSITEKNFEFGVRLQAAMTPHLTAAFLHLGEKYCARFECAAGEDATSKFTP